MMDEHKALVDNSNIKQLNILTISCYSGFLQKIGSTLITLADEDKPYAYESLLQGK